MELEKLILSEDEVLEFVDTKARQDITNTNTTLNKKVDDYTKAVSSDFTNLRSETDNTVRYLTSIITNHQDVTDEELGRIREELLNSIPKNLSDLVDDKGFLTHLPDELITEIELALELDNKGFIKLEEVLDKINTLRQELKNYSDEKTQQHITDTDSKLATLNEVLLQYINTKNSDMTSYVDNLVSSSIKEIIPESLIDAKIEAAAEGHASTDYVDSKVREATADKATISYVDNRVQSYVEDKVTLAEVNKKVNDAVANKATTSYVDTTVADAVKNKATETFVTTYADNAVKDKATVNYVDTTVANAVKDKATTNYVDTKVAGLVGTAPETLDTLAEIANAIKTNDNIINTLNSAIGTKADKSLVDAILSSMDMKADQSYVEGIDNVLKTKADKSELTSLTSLLNNKADKTDLNALREELSSGVSDAVIEEINAALVLKADKKDIPTTVASLADAGEYVKFTHYSTNSTAGIVRTGAGLAITNDGIIRTYAATSDIIKAKTDNYRPITSSLIDEVIKTGLTTNALTWSETEKTNAVNLIGAVQRIDTQGTLRVYGIGGTGNQTTFSVCTNSNNANIDRIPRYEDNTLTTTNLAEQKAVLGTGTPTRDHHATPKKYVDDLVADKLPMIKGTNSNLMAYTYTGSEQSSVRISPSAVKNTIPLRDTEGNLNVGTPTSDSHAASKSYVDTKTANLPSFTVEELEDGSYSLNIITSEV